MIVSENLGYALYRAVEQTKVGLTDKEDATHNRRQRPHPARAGGLLAGAIFAEQRDSGREVKHSLLKLNSSRFKLI